jgi:hypothetical protein
LEQEQIEEVAAISSLTDSDQSVQQLSALRGALMSSIREGIRKILDCARMGLRGNQENDFRDGKGSKLLRIVCRSASFRKSGADDAIEEGPSIAFAGRWAKITYEAQGGWLIKHRSRNEYVCPAVRDRLVSTPLGSPAAWPLTISPFLGGESLES